MTALRLMLSGVWGFMKPFVRQMLSFAGPILAKAATDAVAVTAENLSGATNDEKRNQAYRMIAADLHRQGVAIGTDVTTSMINTAIEVAVQNLKDK